MSGVFRHTLLHLLFFQLEPILRTPSIDYEVRLQFVSNVNEKIDSLKLTYVFNYTSTIMVYW